MKSTAIKTLASVLCFAALTIVPSCCWSKCGKKNGHKTEKMHKKTKDMNKKAMSNGKAATKKSAGY